MKGKIFCFLIMLLMQLSNFISGAIPAAEREALIALYESTNGDNWTNNNGWKTPPLHTDGFAMPGTEGSWVGINIANNVYCIDLRENRLSGTIPPELGNLGYLATLFLFGNYLNGSIPPELGNLSNLKWLHLEGNQLSGSIPSQLGNLSNLTSLWLDTNQMSGSIPPELGNLSNLGVLILENNQLSGSIPPELGNLSNANYLNLRGNQLSGGIPPELGNLNNLQVLLLYYNQLSGGIPSQLGNLNNLQMLMLSDNHLSGSIPSQLGNLSNLNYLYLGGNQLSGSIPPEIGNLSNLKNLYLGENLLSGSIPTELGNLSNLQRLALEGNYLSGSIPSQIGNLSNLQELYLNYNYLGGTIPSSFTNLTYLTQLDIGFNCLFASDSTLRAWLNSHDPDWETHQDRCGGTTIPTVTTNPVSSITQTTAVCGGNVTSDGGATVTSRGVCWGTSPNPTTNNSRTTNGSGTGSFTSSITGLQTNTKYHVRAYATNSLGTSYGADISFITGSGGGTTTPTVTTNPVSSITPTGAICGGNVTSDGGAAVTIRGVCWSTSANPTTGDAGTINGNGTGSFTSTISGLTPGTAYYVRAYAINSVGISYGSAMSFTTPTVNPGSPEIGLNRTSLNFGALDPLKVTGTQSVLIDNTGGGTLNWSAVGNAPWLSLNPASGTGAAVLWVSVAPAGLAVGSYTGTIAITDPHAANSPQTVTVHLQVIDLSTDAPPIGDFSTPTDGSNVMGSIPVTGWALDDIEVMEVKLYIGSFYMGNAVFVAGARPDIEASYPGYPHNDRAGWGYMMLTNFLPDGEVVLTAIAKDSSGKETVLGTKTITIDNAHGSKPFGAIDTPAQGGTASGSSFSNAGWVLTPMPNLIPTDGTTINVWVDGIAIGHPTYNLYREDIAGLFPGYANSNNAGGNFILDTTAYNNGLHTIYWTAADNAGNQEGIGSRFFEILNTGQSVSVSGQKDVLSRKPREELGRIHVDYPGPVTVEKGFARESKPQTIYSDEKGITSIAIKELERVVIHLAGPADLVEFSHLTLNTKNLTLKNSPSTYYYGYLANGSELKPLPIDSTLDAVRGVFYWQPGPGFIGTYSLIFSNSKGDRQKKIDIIILPKN